jgi:hypothetical protein
LQVQEGRVDRQDWGETKPFTFGDIARVRAVHDIPPRRIVDEPLTGAPGLRRGRPRSPLASLGY